MTTKQSAKYLNAAIRNAYGPVRLVMHQLEDLKMEGIHEVGVNPAETVRDQMCQMFLDLLRRVDTTMEELGDWSQDKTQLRPQPESPPQPHPQPPTPVTDVTPVPNSEVRIGRPNRRNKIKPHVLIPVTLHIPFAAAVT